MTKKHFIKLADVIRECNQQGPEAEFTTPQLRALADWCRQENYSFAEDWWLDYIAGRCGPNGGKVNP